MSIPTSPNEMPSEFATDARQIRNMIVSLDQNACVSIHWEIDPRASDAAGENVGEWNVLIENGRRRVETDHHDIVKALWFVTTIAAAQDNEEYVKREAARTAALAKLTTEEKRLLGI